MGLTKPPYYYAKHLSSNPNNAHPKYVCGSPAGPVTWALHLFVFNATLDLAGVRLSLFKVHTSRMRCCAALRCTADACRVSIALLTL